MSAYSVICFLVSLKALLGDGDLVEMEDLDAEDFALSK